MRLFATELLSPPWMASELLWSATATGAPGPHLPGCPTVASMANSRAEGDKLLQGAGSAVLTTRSPSTVPRQWGDKCVPTPVRDLKAKLTLAMEIQNREGETRPQHYEPCPPSCPVPQFPQRNSILLGCPLCSSAKDLDQGMHQHWASKQTLAGMSTTLPHAHCPQHGQLSACPPSQLTQNALEPKQSRPLPVPGSVGSGSTQARLRPGGAGTCCLNVNTSFIHLDWLSSAMLRYT